MNDTKALRRFLVEEMKANLIDPPPEGTYEQGFADAIEIVWAILAGDPLTVDITK